VIATSVDMLAVVLLLLGVAAALFWPVRAGRPPGKTGDEPSAALELARDAKLAELHDLELDFRLGKLSGEDYRALNQTLRAEAVEAIRQIDSTPVNGRRGRTRGGRR
jgi:hypothetical protein